MILIVDYGMGNLRSVEKAFQRLGASLRVSSDPRDIERADRIVVPGVGAFDHAVQELKSRNLFNSIIRAVQNGKPYLGLCLGLQLLFANSEEGKERGFGFIEGSVRLFDHDLKVPHMGWNQVNPKNQQSPLWKNLTNAPYFYFVHSFYAYPKDKSVIEAETDYGTNFASSVRVKNILATQFHPEKSQSNGLTFLKNYLENS